MDQELVAYFDRRFSEFKQELKQELKHELREELGQEVGARISGSAAETRRHFDVAAERLMDRIQLVGVPPGRPAPAPPRSARYRLTVISDTIRR